MGGQAELSSLPISITPNPYLLTMATIRKIVSTVKAPKALGPYSQAVVANSTVYVSGQLGLHPETLEFPSDSAEEQAKQMFENMAAVLEAAGSSCKNVVKTTLLLADIKDW